MAKDFLEYDIHTHAVFVTKSCSIRGMKLSTRPSSLRLDLTVLTCSSDEVRTALAVPTSNSLVCVLARQSWIVANDHKYNIVEVPRVIHLPAI